MIYVIQKNKKDFTDPQVSGGKCTRLLNGPREIYEGKKKAERLINAMAYRISTFHSCAKPESFLKRDTIIKLIDA